jgi:hypothetical protein
MLIFLWILASLGVAYAAKLNRRKPWWWFVLSVFASPPVGGAALWWFNRVRPT